MVEVSGWSRLLLLLLLLQLLVLPLESSKEDGKAGQKLRGNGSGNNELVGVPRADGCGTKPLTDAMAAAMEDRAMRLGPMIDDLVEICYLHCIAIEMGMQVSELRRRICV